MADLQRIEEVYEALQSNTDTTIKSNFFSKSLKVYKETEPDRIRAQSTRDRLKRARHVLLTIEERLGNEFLFLCGAALPVTRLAELKTDLDAFISTLAGWSKTVVFSETFKDLVKEALSDQPSTSVQVNGLPTYTTRKRGQSFDNSSAKRTRVQPSPLEASAIPSYYGLQPLAATTPGNSSSSVSEDSDGEAEDHDGDINGSRGEPIDSNLPNPRRSPVDGHDVPLFAEVYELKHMDVVRVVAENSDGKPTQSNRLTMPHQSGALPFITIPCPPTLALKFLQTRKEVKW